MGFAANPQEPGQHRVYTRDHMQHLTASRASPIPGSHGVSAKAVFRAGARLAIGRPGGKIEAQYDAPTHEKVARWTKNHPLEIETPDCAANRSWPGCICCGSATGYCKPPHRSFPRGT